MRKSDEENRYLLKTLDDISELIYIADFESYDILYINSTGMKQFHLEEIAEGTKCYEVLQGRESPCPFCTNKYLVEGEDYIWNFYNPFTERYYLLKDRLLPWNGRKARMEIALDMTVTQNEKLALQYALDTEKTVLECVKILTEGRNITESINRVVCMIGQHLLADRAYIFEIKNDKMYNTFEWCKEGVESQQRYLQDLDVSIINSWKEEFKHQRCVVIENLEEIDGGNLYEVLYPQGIRSLVIAPLEQNGEQTGYFGVDNPPVEKIRNIISLLETLRYFIMMTVQRKSDEQLLKKLSLFDTLTGLYNRNKYILDVNAFSKGNKSLGVLYLDVNGLKEVNDQYGHAFGDFVLKKCAEKMKVIFDSASIYRTGGDEFIVICEINDENTLLKLTDTLKKEFLEDELCSVAIGYRWAEKPSELERMIEDADNFMYEDKQKYYAENCVLENRHHRCPRDLRYISDGKIGAAE